MNLFRNATLRQKQTRIMMTSVTVALLLAAAGSISSEVFRFRGELVRMLHARCEVIGGVCTAALDFNDAKTAAETMSSLSRDPRIIAAVLYDKSGAVFATYQNAQQSPHHAPGKLKEDVALSYPHSLGAARRIVQKGSGESAGTLYMESDLQDLHTRLGEQLLIGGVVLLVALSAAWFLSGRLQRLIVEPILQLLGTARAVTASRDYTKRATRQSNDELGQLVDGFNDMLQQVQSRDVELKQAQDFLEQRVAERTNDLQAEVAERRRSERAVMESQRFLQSSLDALSAHIAILDESGVIISVNAAWNRFAQSNSQAFARLGVGVNYIEVCDLIQSDCAQEAPALARGIRAVLSGETEEFHLEYPCHSPSEQRWFLVRVTRFGSEGSKRIVVAHENITERKRAEAESAELNRSLVETSRMAGMAEVATSVLHNVGNVLNSVNVSATLISDRVRTSKGPSLTRVCGLMRDHAADLGTYLTADPKGKQVPSFLDTLAEHLTTDQTAIQQELASLTKNIEHIKDIVSMQQSYAKVSGVVENLTPAELVEDALRMNLGSFEKHAIAVVRDLAADLPRVCVDKHKTLQILINLVRNAKHACDDSSRTDKRITLRAVSDGSGSVKISVTDNGVGIPPENLTRIFNHGFTTKKDGHGFGLHSGANAAREIGGRLSVASDGPGCGATFTLELPLTSNARNTTLVDSTPQIAA